MRALGLDLGSSSIKGGLLNTDAGTIDAVRSRPFPGPVSSEDRLGFGVDPEAIVTATRSLVDELLAESGPISSVWVCSQMGGVVLCDDALRPVTNYLSWRDQRVLHPHPSGGTWFDRVRESIGDADFARLGRELKPGSALCLLTWLAETGALPSSATRAMGLGEYVIALLCQSPPKTERTSALGTIDLQTRQWHVALFDRLGFGRLKWPELIDVSESAGELATPHGPVPCHPAIGDHQAALFGAGLADGELSVNVSTGSQVSLLTPELQLGEYQTRPYFGGRFLNTITHLPAGRSLNAVVNLLTELPRAEGMALTDPWSTIAQAVEATTATDLDLRLTFFAGSLGSEGELRHMTLENLTLGHLFRAAFQNIADNSAVAAARLSATPGWQRLVLSGGLPQKLPALRDEITARFACPVRSVAVAEETLQGLLELAQR